MTILFDATRPVKPTHTRRFAAGLLACLPVTHLDHTHADADAYALMAADVEQARRDFDKHLEERYAMSRHLDAVCAGTLPF